MSDLSQPDADHADRPAHSPDDLPLPPAVAPPSNADDATILGDDTDILDDDTATGDDTPLPDEADDTDEPPLRSRLPLLIVAGVALVVAGVSLGLLFARWSQPPGDDQVIARVGATNITRGEFAHRYQPGSDPKELLDQLIEAELVVQASTREGTTVETAMIDQQVKQIREQQGDEDTFKKFLLSNKIASETALRDLLARDQLIQAMVLKHTTVQQAHARHILLGGQDPAAIAARKAEAEALFKQIQDGGDFAALAKEKSEDTGSKDSGGDLGWAPKGVFVPPFDDAVFSMKPGELRLVQTDFGWHIIQLTDAPAVRSLEDRRYFNAPSVQQAISETFLPWVKSLRTDADTSGQVTIVVPPADLVPTPGAAIPTPAIPTIQPQ